MKKRMVSLEDSTDAKLNERIKREFYGRIGALSIIVEGALREYFEAHPLPAKPPARSKKN